MVETCEKPVSSRRQFDPVLRYAIEELGLSQAEIAGVVWQSQQHVVKRGSKIPWSDEHARWSKRLGFWQVQM
jgi:hypothetical protein